MILRLMLSIAVVTAIGCGTARAVALNPDGFGEVLLFPFFSANDINQTLITLVNSTDRVKALRVRFRESRNSRQIAAFNLYLGPRDTWAAGVARFQFLNNSEAVGVLAPDPSCTVPAFSEEGIGVSTFSPALMFSPDLFTGDNADGAGDQMARLNQGFIEVIEMGEVAFEPEDGSAELPLGAFAVAGSSGVQDQCDVLVEAWSEGGLWDADPQTDMSEPTGGIYGTASIINVLEGYRIAPPVEAITGFYNPGEGLPVSLHASPASAMPDLNSAATGGSGDPVLASVLNDNGEVQSLFFDRPVDAVSAVLMTDSARNHFNIESNTDSATEWVITFPTRQYYVSQDQVQPPFVSAITGESSPGAGDASAAEPAELNVLNRDGVSGNGSGSTLPASLGFAANVLAFSQGSTSVSRILKSPDRSDIEPSFPETAASEAGRAQLQFLEAGQGLPDNTGTVVLTGLPAIGFAAEISVNGTLQNEQGQLILTSYGRTARHIQGRVPSATVQK